MEPMTLQFTSDKKEYVQANKEYLKYKKDNTYAGRDNKLIIILSCFLIFPVICIFKFFFESLFEKFRVIFDLFALCSMLVSIFFSVREFFLSRFIRKDAIDFSWPIRIKIDEESIKVINKEGEKTYTRKTVFGFFESKSYYFVEFSENKREYQFIPKRIITTEEQKWQLIDLVRPLAL
jgi:hypothetical protein